MDIDFKFFNTYGPSLIYYIGDKEKTMIGHIDLTMRFRLSIKNSTDIYTKYDIIKSIKSYIENLYDIGNLDIPNLITYITNEFKDRINFIEFMNYNNFRLGIQHIWQLDDEYTNNPLYVPEFLNIRNILDDDGNIVPDIDMEVI